MTDRDRAESLWQLLNTMHTTLLFTKRKGIETGLSLDYILSMLKKNRPNSVETQIDQDKQFAKLVFNELPLSSDIPLVNRLITMCKERLNIID